MPQEQDEYMHRPHLYEEEASSWNRLNSSWWRTFVRVPYQDLLIPMLNTIGSASPSYGSNDDLFEAQGSSYSPSGDRPPDLGSSNRRKRSKQYTKSRFNSSKTLTTTSLDRYDPQVLPLVHFC